MAHLVTVFRECEMFELMGVAHATTFFRRASLAFDPTRVGGWRQNYNRKRFSIWDFDQDFVQSAPPRSAQFNEWTRCVGHEPCTDR
jgi:hypothetical protein